MGKKRKVFLKTLAAMISLLILAMAYPPSRSLLIMAPYSHMHYRDSFMHGEGIEFTIPGGLKTAKRDWYPLMIAFTDDAGFSRYIGEEASFTVLYAFGHFDLFEGRSVYFDPQSSYYSSFYGGYAIKLESGRPFGYNDDGSVNAGELARVPRFDQLSLVLPSIGCPDSMRVFEERILSIADDVSYAGHSGWTRIDSEIKTNGSIHGFTKFHTGYLQFGMPPSSAKGPDYPPIGLKGRVYVRYFEELGATFVLYVMAPDWDVIDECDRALLSKAVIRRRGRGFGRAAG